MGTTFKKFSDGDVTVETTGKGAPSLDELKTAAGMEKIVSGPAASSGAAWTPQP